MKSIEDMNFKEFIKNWIKGSIFVFCLLLSVAIVALPVFLSIFLGTFVNTTLFHLIWLILLTLPIGVWIFIQTVFKLPDKLWSE